MPRHKFIEFIAMIFLLLALSLIGCGASDAGDIVFGQTKVEQNTIVDADMEDTQEAEQHMQENFEGSEAEAETSEEPMKEVNDLYDFSPVSYDLSALPAMENKLYAEWDGKIYFRQYSDEDFEGGALWAKFDYVPDTEKEIMCLEPDGTLTQVGTDYGHGIMFIVNGRLCSQRYTSRKNSESDDSYATVVYSCELDEAML